MIAQANFAQFSPGQKVQFHRVESRMVLWCKAGKGVVTANGKVCLFEEGRYLLLPWGHSIRYEADREDPFSLAGIHIIPHHRPSQPVRFAVAHQERDPLAHVSFRRDADIPNLPGLKWGRLEGQAALRHLLEYIVHLFLRGDPEEWMARQLARQLLCELILSERRSELRDHGGPVELERMKQYIAFHLNRPLSLRDLVEFSRLSPSTVGRMFREHLKTTPVAWIMRTKMERAQTLLRTQRLSVAQVGEQVGISDPYYFSKRFKKETGQSPQPFRKKSAGFLFL